MAQWAEEEIFVSGDVFFESLFRRIAQARKRVWIESYILRHDAVGVKLLDLLAQAAGRGVSVRLHIDAIGSQEWLSRRLSAYADAPFEIRVFNAPRFSKLWDGLKRFNRFTLRRAFARMNRRNHRKLAIIDDNDAYLGSMNMCAEPVERIYGASAWRDTGVRVRGEGVLLLAASFDEVWQRQARVRTRRGEERLALILDKSTWLRRMRAHRALLRELRRARSRVLITTAYFVPERRLRARLRRAAERGVRVEIIVPGKSDVFFLPWVSRLFFKRLMDSGVRVFEFQERMIHAKTLLFDDKALVGSSNLNNRSLYWDLEVDVWLTKPESIEMLVRQFELDKLNAVECTPESLKSRLSLSRFAGLILLRLSRVF